MCTTIYLVEFYRQYKCVSVFLSSLHGHWFKEETNIWNIIMNIFLLYVVFSIAWFWCRNTIYISYEYAIMNATSDIIVFFVYANFVYDGAKPYISGWTPDIYIGRIFRCGNEKMYMILHFSFMFAWILI